MAKINLGILFDDLKTELLADLEKRVVLFLRRNLKAMVEKILLDLLEVDAEGDVVFKER